MLGHTRPSHVLWATSTLCQPVTVPHIQLLSYLSLLTGPLAKTLFFFLLTWQTPHDASGVSPPL